MISASGSTLLRLSIRSHCPEPLSPHMNFYSDLCFLSSSTPFPHIPFFFFLTYTAFFTVAHDQRCQLKSLPTGLPVGRKQKMNACWSRCPPADSLQKAFTEDFRSHCSVHFRSSGIFTRAKLYLESYDGKKDATVSKTVDQRA